MSEVIKQTARSIIEEGRYKRIEETEKLAEKCRKCLHYLFRDPSEVKWDHTFVPVGDVCSYATPRDLGVYGLAHPEIFSVEEVREEDRHGLPEIRYFVPDEEGNLREVGFCEYWARLSGERTIDDRIRLGECEFENIPPRSKPWHEKDDEWDSKYKETYLKSLVPRIRRLKILSEEELQELIEEELSH